MRVGITGAAVDELKRRPRRGHLWSYVRPRCRPVTLRVSSRPDLQFRRNGYICVYRCGASSFWFGLPRRENHATMKVRWVLLLCVWVAPSSCFLAYLITWMSNIHRRILLMFLPHFSALVFLPCLEKKSSLAVLWNAYGWRLEFWSHLFFWCVLGQLFRLLLSCGRKRRPELAMVPRQIQAF